MYLINVIHSFMAIGLTEGNDLVDSLSREGQDGGDKVARCIMLN